jgi:hypothetical protein
MTTRSDLKKAFGWNDTQAGPAIIGEPGYKAPTPAPDKPVDKPVTPADSK